MATDSKAAVAGALNKPCNACRRRKVRCDKLHPCTNCAKHGWTCLYDPEGPPGTISQLPGTVGEQGALHERIDRLERLIEELSVGDSARSRRLAMERELRNEPPAGGSRGESGGNGGNGGGVVRPEREGIQVFEPNTSYFMGPNFWMNLHEFIYEPRCLLRVDYDDTFANSWPFLAPMPHNLAHMRLPQGKEDVIVDAFYEIVEPFIRITHESSFRQDLADFRRGACKFEREFEALLFAVQLLTVMAMPTAMVLQRTGQPRKELMAHLRMATEMGLSRANVMQSRKIAIFQALLCYITFLFYTCQAEIANTQLGLASRVGMRIGLHRDPKFYNFPPWTSEIRRRLWNHFMLMDSQLFTGEGSDSGLGMTSNVGRSTNVDDGDWGPPRLGKPGVGPEDQDGWTTMSFVILRDEILNTMRKWGQLRASGEKPDALARMLDETEQFLIGKFLTDVDSNIPIQRLTDARFRAHFSYVRLFIQFNAARSSRQSNIEQQAMLFRQSIDMLEKLAHSENLAREHHWGWLYNWPVPWSALAFTLTGLVHQLDHPDVDRAWRQVDVCWRRHMNSEVQIDHLPAWKAVERLCDQAMYYHPDRIHTGCAYTQRTGESSRSSQSPSSGIQSLAGGQSLAGSVSGTSSTAGPGVSSPHAQPPTIGPPFSMAPESFFGDLGLFSHFAAPQDSDMVMSQFLTPPPPGPQPQMMQQQRSGQGQRPGGDMQGGMQGGMQGLATTQEQQDTNMMYPNQWPPPGQGGYPPGYR